MKDLVRDNPAEAKRIAQHLRAARDLAGRSAAEVAQDIGIARASYSHIELGSDKAPKLTLRLQARICSVLRLDPLVFWPSGLASSHVRGRVTTHFETFNTWERAPQAMHHVVQSINHIRPGIIGLSLLAENGQFLVSGAVGDSMLAKPPRITEERRQDALAARKSRSWDFMHSFNLREAADAPIAGCEPGYVVETVCPLGVLWTGVHPMIDRDDGDVISQAHHIGDAISQCFARNEKRLVADDHARRLRAVEHRLGISPEE